MPGLVVPFYPAEYPELSGSSNLVSTLSPDAKPSGSSSLSAAGFATHSPHGSFSFDGFLISRHPQGYYRVERYMGDETVPQDIRRLRRASYELMRRMGTPMLVKHMWSDGDVDLGVAQRSPNFDDVYGQTRMADPFSWGTGFCSIALSDDEWIRPDGTIIRSIVAPDPSWPNAPKYRGFGPGLLVYVIQPDAAEDFFKLSPTGALLEVQTANAIFPWYPVINDNDLLINVTLNDQGSIISTEDRFQAKLVNPVTIRGLDRRGRDRNRHLVNQIFPMTRVPENNVLQRVEADR